MPSDKTSLPQPAESIGLGLPTLIAQTPAADDVSQSYLLGQQFIIMPVL